MSMTAGVVGVGRDDILTSNVEPVVRVTVLNWNPILLLMTDELMV